MASRDTTREHEEAHNAFNSDRAAAWRVVKDEHPEEQYSCKSGSSGYSLSPTTGDPASNARSALRGILARPTPFAVSGAVYE